MGGEYAETMTYDDFVVRFKAEFAPVMEVQQLAMEFQDLRQENEIVTEITTKFLERALLVLQYAADEEMSKARHHDRTRMF